MVTWDELTNLEREDLRFLVKSGTGAIYKPRQVRLTALGLIAGDGLFSTPTDAGRALVASASARDFSALSPDRDTLLNLSLDAGVAAADRVHALQAENEALRQQLADARAALERIASGANMPAYCKEHGIQVSDNPTITMQRIAAKALQAGESGEGE